MHRSEITKEIVEILKEAEGVFLTLFQICIEIEKAYPKLWNKILRKYQSQYIEFVAGAMVELSVNNPDVIQEYLKWSRDVVTMGQKQVGVGSLKELAIWRWRRGV